MAFFAYVTALSFFVQVPPRRRLQLLTLNAGVVTGLLMLPVATEFASKLLVSVIRDWLPAPLILLGYREAGLLTFPRRDRSFENAFLRGDELVFRLPLLHVLNQNCRLPHWLDDVLEFFYLQCYVIVPSGIAVLYFLHRGHTADQYWSVVLPAVFVAYGLTPLFPAQPPRKLEAQPSVFQHTSRLREFNLWIHDHASIKVNTFPSGHVAGAVSASLALLTVVPTVGVLYIIVAVGIVAGSVRGRYHYFLDAVTGILVAVGSYLVARLM